VKLPPVAEPLRRVELHINYQCVNSCVFCSERDHMREFRDHPASFSEIAGILRRKRAEGFRHATFTGGEPTLYPRIWDVLSLARDLGYATFLISNGCALSMAKASRRILPLVDELCLSVHGTGGLHDRLTRNPKAFGRMSATLENVEAHPGKLFVMVNTVVSRLNLARLPAILDLVSGCSRVQHFLLSHMAPEGDGLRRYSRLVVRHAELAAAAAGLAGTAARKGIALRVFGVPACLLGGNWRMSNDLYFSPRVTIGRVRLPDGSPGWFEEPGLRPTREREYRPACARCSLLGRCGGVFKRYRKEFPGERVRPLRVRFP